MHEPWVHERHRAKPAYRELGGALAGFLPPEILTKPPERKAQINFARAGAAQQPA